MNGEFIQLWGGKIKEPGKIPTSGGWIYNGETLGAFCFSQEWFSGDNYEYYYDEFLNNVDSKGEFFNNPGQFFGDTIPLSSKYVSPFPLLSDYPWTGDLPVELSLCQKVITTSNVSIDDDGTANDNIFIKADNANAFGDDVDLSVTAR